MTQTIYVPEGDEGDEAIKRLIPALHDMATSAQNRRRTGGEP